MIEIELWSFAAGFILALLLELLIQNVRNRL